MIELQFPAPVGAHVSPDDAEVAGGLLAVVRDRQDLDTLIRLCSTLRRDDRSPRTRWPREPESRSDDRLRQLVGALLSGRFGDEPAPNLPDRTRPDADDPFDALLVGLTALASLWPDDEQALTLCLALALPGAMSGEVEIRLGRPRAAWWMTPGSIVAGISVGVVLKAARWAAVAWSTVVAKSAESAARDLIEDLRTRAGVASRHEPLPRLDHLADAERESLRARPVLVVLLHGLFGTDLGTFDGLISRLRQRTPAQLDASLTALAASGPRGLVRAQSGVAGLQGSFRAAVERGGERVMRVSDLEVQRFVAQHVGLVGWPHDSLAPVDACATELAVLLHHAFADAPVRHVVFVCHSQGGLLARATALELARIHAPAARWAERIGAIATFGTPHRGAALAETGGGRSREMAAFLAMRAGIGLPSSLSAVLTVIGARSFEGLEDVKAFNASTPHRENAYVQRLLREELATAWPNGGHRPDLLAVGGRLGEAQKAAWRDRIEAAFVWRKLGHHDHDLVVEVASSLSSLVKPRVALEVECDHFGYFGDEASSAPALDLTLAMVWTLLGEEVEAWPAALAERERRQAWPERAVFKLKPRAPAAGAEDAEDAGPSEAPPAPSR